LSELLAARADTAAVHPSLEGPAMADVGLIVLIILLFGLLALVLKGAERL
jgi:hypothetical protein